LRIGAGDYLRPSALIEAKKILASAGNGRLPDMCPGTVPGLPFPEVPCVMTFTQANVLRAAVLAYNLAITAQVVTHRATLVDTFSLLNDIKADGYRANGKTLTMDYIGGFFSLDAMHPTATGHAIIANRWIDTMNRRLGESIPRVNIDKVASEDPLVFAK
jgi:hypothetical protein